MNSDVQRLPRYSRLPLIAREDKWEGGMTYTTWYHLMYWYYMIWYDMIPDNVIWCQWIICCTIWCSLVFIYLLVFDIHIDYLTWPYYHLINEYRLKKCTADFVTGSWSISPKIDIRVIFLDISQHFIKYFKLYVKIIEKVMVHTRGL